MVCSMGWELPYTCCFVVCCFKDIFKTAINIHVLFKSTFFSKYFLCSSSANLLVRVSTSKFALSYPIHKRLRQYCGRHTLTLHNTVYWFGRSHLRAHCRWATKRCHIRQTKGHFPTAEGISCPIWNKNNTLWCQNRSLKTLYTTIT